MQKAKRFLLSIIIALVTALCGVAAVAEIIHHHNYGHFAPYGVHVDVRAERYSIGIPGQTMMYSPVLSNFTLLPLKLTACDSISDDGGRPQTRYPYAVQRWDAAARTWDTVSEESPRDFCQHSTLGEIRPHVEWKLLWPGMSVYANDGEAVGALEPFKKGDTARFVVFSKLDKHGGWHDGIPSSSFQIQDDVQRDNVNYRVKH